MPAAGIVPCPLHPARWRPSPARRMLGGDGRGGEQSDGERQRLPAGACLALGLALLGSACSGPRQDAGQDGVPGGTLRVLSADDIDGLGTRPSPTPRPPTSPARPSCWSATPTGTRSPTRCAVGPGWTASRSGPASVSLRSSRRSTAGRPDLSLTSHVPQARVTAFKADPELARRLSVDPSACLWFLTLGTHRAAGAIADVRVRQAVNYRWPA